MVSALYIGRQTMKKDGDKLLEVTLSVDMLCNNNRPTINFWLFCLLNDYVQKDEEGNNKPTVDIIHLVLSSNENKNEAVNKMLEKYKITVLNEGDLSES